MDLSDFIWDHTAPILAVLSSTASAVGAWLLSRRNLAAMLERSRLEMNAEVSTAETAERTAFRAMLMTEVAAMRLLIKECEADKEALHERLNEAMAQSLVLRATVEIMEKRVAFSRQQHASRDHVVSLVNPGANDAPIPSCAHFDASGQTPSLPTGPD